LKTQRIGKDTGYSFRSFVSTNPVTETWAQFTLSEKKKTSQIFLEFQKNIVSEIKKTTPNYWNCKTQISFINGRKCS